MTEEQNFLRVSEEFHNIIVNSDLDRLGALVAFANVWVSCNAQMDLENSGNINTNEFIKETKEYLKECRRILVESIPQMMEEVKLYKQLH